MTDQKMMIIQRDSAYEDLIKDQRLGSIVQKWGPCSLSTGKNYFFELCRSIIAQQIATKVANTIASRLVTMYQGKVTAEKVALTGIEELKGIGISTRKAQTMKAIAESCMDNNVDLSSLDRMSDEEIQSHLIQIKGIGSWTVTMFLIFAMNRPRVIPAHDFGIRKAIKLLYELEEMPSAADVFQYYEAWAPHESAASWYLWRSLENI